MNQKPVSYRDDLPAGAQGCILVFFALCLVAMSSLICWFVMHEDGLTLVVILPLSLLFASLIALVLTIWKGEFTSKGGFLRIRTGAKSRGKTAVAYSPKVSDRTRPSDLKDEALEGPRKLKSEWSRVGVFVFTLLFTTFCTGMTTAGIFGWYFSERTFAVAPVLGFFTILCLCLIGATIYHFLGIFNPNVEVSISDGAATRGKPIHLEWRLSGKSSNVKSVEIRIEALETIRIGEGKSSSFQISVVNRLPVVSVVRPDKIQYGKASFTIPSDSMHTFETGNHHLAWWLIVEAEIPRRPDILERFELRVRP